MRLNAVRSLNGGSCGYPVTPVQLHCRVGIMISAMPATKIYRGLERWTCAKDSSQCVVTLARTIERFVGAMPTRERPARSAE